MNGVCSNSTLIDSVPFVDNGLISPYPDPVGADSAPTTCDFIRSATRGVWYLLQGDGRCYSASTEGSAINTLLAVYDAEAGCEGLTCMYERRYHNETLHWISTAGAGYYIFVAGFPDETGQYVLNVAVRLVNIFCLFGLCLCNA